MSCEKDTVYACPPEGEKTKAKRQKDESEKTKPKRRKDESEKTKAKRRKRKDESEKTKATRRYIAGCKALICAFMFSLFRYFALCPLRYFVMSLSSFRLFVISLWRVRYVAKAKRRNGTNQPP